MTGMRQAWLVARREMRERSRSRGFQASVVFLIIGVAAMLILPVLLKPGSVRDVGVTGPVPAALAVTIAQQAQTAGITARVRPYTTLTAGEQAVRQGQVDVLVAGARRLEWKGRADEQLKAVVAGAIQLAAVRERAAAAGIGPAAAAALLTPVPVANVQLGSVAGPSPGDEMAVLVMTVVLFFGISVFGQMVLTGVLEEKASRVVEVLLARAPPRVLLAGKIAGIGLLGLAQIGVTALAALVAAAAVRSAGVPAVRGPVLLPPCSRQRPLAIAGWRQGWPARVQAPQRGAARKSPGGLPWRSQPRRSSTGMLRGGATALAADGATCGAASGGGTWPAAMDAASSCHWRPTSLGGPQR